MARQLGERTDGLSSTDASQKAITAINILSKAVGETSNMLDIVTSLDLADKIIRP